MNQIIQAVYEMGMSQTVYNIFFALGFVSVFLFVVLTGRKMKIEIWKSVVLVLIVYPLVVLWMMVLYWIENGFRGFGGNNIVRVFVYVPLITYPVAKLLKIDMKKCLSLLAFAPVSVHAVSHFGCIFPGCCRGYPSSWGLYNVSTDDIRFPNQPMEAIIAWLIIFYLLARAKKRNYKPDGVEYPVMLAIFGLSRFLCEFLRENYKIFLGCSSLAFHALFMFVVGIIWIIVAKKKNAALKIL